MKNGLIKAIDESIAHWENNLKKLKKLPWTKWIHTEITTRRFGLGNGFIMYNSITYNLPQIYSDKCSLCRYANYLCISCPLYGMSRSCCDEWQNVVTSLLTSPTTKMKATKAMQQMINKLQSLKKE